MKTIAILSVFFAFMVAIDCRHVHHKKELKGSKKTEVVRKAQKKQFEAGGGCCGQESPMGGSLSPNPLSCCQAASPPPCCHNMMQSGVYVPPAPPPVTSTLQTSQPSGSCCPPVSPPPQANQNCCQSPQAPPCCSRVPGYMTLQGCCTTVQTPPDQNSCCQGANAPPCCINLNLKNGDEKNVSLTSGGNNYVLNIKLNPGDTTKAPTPTSGPTKATSGATGGSTGGSPTSKATSGPTKATTGPTKATSGPTKATTASTGSTAATVATTPKPTTAPASNDCTQKALAAHNTKRAIHNSPKMALDPELNKAAQAYADKLAQAKKVEHSTNAERPEQGENLAKKCSNPDQGFNCEEAVNMWYNEVNSYDFGSPGYSSSTGHFTQLVWKGSTKLGFGKAKYVDAGGNTCYVIVGRYKPAGNIKGKYPENVERGGFIGS